MRITVLLDDNLVKKTQEYTGITERSTLIRFALTELVQAEATKRLAAMGGTMTNLEPPPRRRMQ